MSQSADQNSALSRYFSEIRNYPPLSREREQVLARNVRSGCRTSRDRLIESNLSFVVKVASEYRNLGLPFEDLLNEGNLGLIEAAHRFDASKGTKFITYAIWWIRKSIFRALSERSSLVRVPSYQMKKVREIRQTEQSLSRQLGRRPSRAEISRRLERSLGKIDQALQFSMREISLDHRVGKERDQPISEYLVDESLPDAEEDLIRREATSLISEAVAGLSNQERQVICYRYGIVGGRPRTLKEVGRIMRISRERVRQIENQAKQKLRKIFSVRGSVQHPPRPAEDDPGRRASHSTSH